MLSSKLFHDIFLHISKHLKNHGVSNHAIKAAFKDAALDIKNISYDINSKDILIGLTTAYQQLNNK